MGFTRVVGDGERLANSTLPSGDPIVLTRIFARFAYLADVFTLPEFRGHGLGKAIIVATLTESGDPKSDDAVSRDSTQWKWVLFATKAKDM